MAVMPAMQLGPNHKYCPECATVLDVRAPVCSRCGAPQAVAPGAGGSGKPKSKLAAALLAFFLGGMGVHRFYLGQWGWGLLMFGTFWTFIPSLVALVDFIRYLVMSEDEFQRRYGALGGGTVAAIVAGVACPVVGVAGFGILAAIAIPNFVRAGLRARDAGVRLQLETLANAQETQRAGGGGLLLPPSASVPAEGDLGRAMEWGADELAWAQELGWRIPAGKTDARFSMAVAPGGASAASYCAETDFDGDGRHAAWVLFRPRMDSGESETPPPAPCSDAVELGGDVATLEYLNGASPVGEAIRVSPPDVY
jgi:TM2 domain-containing membrane protein YozV